MNLDEAIKEIAQLRQELKRFENCPSPGVWRAACLIPGKCRDHTEVWVKQVAEWDIDD